jgi:hypothetical protein
MENLSFVIVVQVGPSADRHSVLGTVQPAGPNEKPPGGTAEGSGMKRVAMPGSHHQYGRTPITKARSAASRGTQLHPA